MGNTYGDFTVFEYTVTVWFEMLCGGGGRRDAKARNGMPCPGLSLPPCAPLAGSFSNLTAKMGYF